MALPALLLSTVTTSSIIPRRSASSRNDLDDIDGLARVSMFSRSFPFGGSPNGILQADAGVKEYTVFPLIPNRVPFVDQKITTFAEKDSVRKITGEYRREYNDVLYWELRATNLAFQTLRHQLGQDAYIFETTQIAEQAQLNLSDLPPLFNATNFTHNSMSGEPSRELSARQRSAPEDLKVVCQPQGQALENVKDYRYASDWRVKPTVYLVDSGLDTTSTDFQLGIDRWLFSPAVKRRGKNTKTDDDPDSHGSCVLSKAIGITNGVYKNQIGFRSKNSEVVMVKVNQSLSFDEVFWAFSAIKTDILNSPRTEPTVIAFPWNAYQSNLVPWFLFKSLLQDLFNVGATIIVSAGNNATTPGSENVDTLPALWESPQFPLIVIGAVDNAGDRASFSQGGPHVSVLAPGLNIQCARRYNFHSGSGTSFSTGMVAGLAAYGLALQRVDFVPSIVTPINVKLWLSNQASYVRQAPNGPRVIWNEEQES